MIIKYKTPLRYPGGKSKSTKKLIPDFPDLFDYDQFIEPFLGGGSVSLAVSQLYPKTKIVVNDIYEPLYNFWKTLQNSGSALIPDLLAIQEKCKVEEDARVIYKDMFDVMHDISQSNHDRAVAFWVINKCSFGGLNNRGSFSRQAVIKNFSVMGINKLPEYSRIIKNWTILNGSYDALLKNQSNSFVYLDPPYEIKDALYGKGGNTHKGFDHDHFANVCNSLDLDMMISYNNDSSVKNRFPDWKQKTFDQTYTMRTDGSYMEDQKKRKELVLTNYKKIYPLQEFMT
jgi:DNA adenine methylase|tara:strand:+ start:109 stop:966 length:858 start_codon:yes stop_codon:yes gene_type:complete